MAVRSAWPISQLSLTPKLWKQRKKYLNSERELTRTYTDPIKESEKHKTAVHILIGVVVTLVSVYARVQYCCMQSGKA